MAYTKERDRKCILCGRKFHDDSSSNQKKYCSEKCKNKASKAQQKAWWKKKREKPFGGYQKEEPVKKANLSNMTIEEIQKAARAAGMSYGQYVAAMEK